MSEITRVNEQGLQQVDPASRGVDLSIRLAGQGDFGAIDALQKSESDKLGFMPESAIRKRIEEGNVLVGESAGGFVGYCLGVDRYQKRSELGIIYQMAVSPAARRRNVAAALLAAQFEKSAYGTKLYCCWCKQSLSANLFWESMGFVPLAFRAGRRARSKKQAERPVVHVFWQKRIRVGDDETAWWYPYETQGGAMMEGRVVLPLPAGMGWDEAVPVVLPGAERRAAEQALLSEKVETLAAQERAAKRGSGKQRAGKRGSGNSRAAEKKPAGRVVMNYGFGAGSGFGKAAEQVTAVQAVSASGEDEQAIAKLKAEKDAARQALKAAQRKNDPELVAYARELRDRWQEHVAARPGIIEARERGKYSVRRALGGSRGADGGSAAVKGGATKVKQISSVERAA